jgi:hypothetical protein
MKFSDTPNGDSVIRLILPREIQFDKRHRVIKFNGEIYVFLPTNAPKNGELIAVKDKDDYWEFGRFLIIREIETCAVENESGLHIFLFEEAAAYQKAIAKATEFNAKESAWELEVLESGKPANNAKKESPKFKQLDKH